MNIEAGLGFRSIDNRCSSRLCKVDMSAYKISMKMRLENIFDLCFTLRRKTEVRKIIPDRIDNGRFEGVGGKSEMLGQNNPTLRELLPVAWLRK